MLRRAISTLALTAVLAAPAVAQDPYESPFWYQGVGDVSGGVFEGPFGTWQGSFNNEDWFQVFCVDFDNTVTHPTDHFDVWVTPFESDDQSRLRSSLGGGNYSNYIEAAQFASLMAQPHALNLTVQTDIQRAIWWAMGFTTGGAVWEAAYDNYAAAAHAIVIDPNEWIIITGFDKQELIAFQPNPPQETVPEPATMTLLATGLAGMAAARRRKNKS